VKPTNEEKKKPKRPKRGKKSFQKREIEIVKKQANPNSFFKRLRRDLDHSYRVDVQRETVWTKMLKFFHVKSINEQKTRSDRFFYKVKNWWPLSKLSGRIFLIYLIIVVLGTLLLAIPGIVINTQFQGDFLTSLFTTSSAFSDTGINIANPSADYSFWGQLIILILIELGGIGVMTLKIVLYLAINKKISINDTYLAQAERGSGNLKNAIVLVRNGFLVLTSIQIFAIGFLFFVFYFTEPGTVSDNLGPDGLKMDLGTISPYHNFSKSLWYSIFHSTSAINNAGFDIVSANSLQPYNVQGHHSYLIQIVFLIEWVLGGLGYPTFHDIKLKIQARKTGEIVRFSLFTKLNFIVYFTLFVLGPLSVFGSEIANRSNSLIFNYYQTNADGSVVIGDAKASGVVAMDIIFNVSSTRNAGFSSINVNDFNAASKTIMSMLMFVGSAPSSTAGGIRTTTFAIIILGTVSIIRNRDNVLAFKRRVPTSTVHRAFAVFFMSIFVLTIAIVIGYIDSHNAIGSGHTGDATIVELMLLFSSAFGTVGLNPFDPSQTLALGALTKVVLILIMFLGQLGISNALTIFVKSGAKRHYDYIEEDVVIG